MLLHQISVHIFMPAGIDTAGLAAENASKPEITRKIEEGDKVISAEECAGHLLRGTQSLHLDHGQANTMGRYRFGEGILSTDELLRDRPHADAKSGSRAGE